MVMRNGAVLGLIAVWWLASCGINDGSPTVSGVTGQRDDQSRIAQSANKKDDNVGGVTLGQALLAVGEVAPSTNDDGIDQEQKLVEKVSAMEARLEAARSEAQATPGEGALVWQDQLDDESIVVQMEAIEQLGNMAEWDPQAREALQTVIDREGDEGLGARAAYLLARVEPLLAQRNAESLVGNGLIAN